MVPSPGLPLEQRRLPRRGWRENSIVDQQRSVRSEVAAGVCEPTTTNCLVGPVPWEGREGRALAMSRSIGRMWHVCTSPRARARTTYREE